MKFLLFLIHIVLLQQAVISQSCNNWLITPSYPSFFRIGDLDIPGYQLTVEARINRTAPWNGVDLYQGDVVSKHEGPGDVNYLLRPGSAEITTTYGYFKTPVICPIQLNKTYHVAMVYDGATLKFYRNGFLMSQVSAKGRLIQNNSLTQIGLFHAQVINENFIGYINEVKIWNVARTQHEIRSFMDKSLTTPRSMPGLLAYYTFDNAMNKQGNSSWNGKLGGSASIRNTNGNCSIIRDSCRIIIHEISIKKIPVPPKKAATSTSSSKKLPPKINKEVSPPPVVQEKVVEEKIGDKMIIASVHEDAKLLLPIINDAVTNQYRERKNLVSKEIEVWADSITIYLYDNGEIDGDSVSIFFNDQLLAAEQILSARPFRLRVVLDKSREYNELAMFANNLGSIPPNTALMKVSDGNKVFELRLMSTLVNNGTIRIRNKKRM